MTEKISENQKPAPKFHSKHCNTECFCGICGVNVRVGVGDGLYLEGTNSPVCIHCADTYGRGDEGFVTEIQAREADFLDAEYRWLTETQERTAQALERARLLFASDPLLMSVKFDGCCFKLERDPECEGRMSLVDHYGGRHSPQWLQSCKMPSDFYRAIVPLPD